MTLGSKLTGVVTKAVLKRWEAVDLRSATRREHSRFEDVRETLVLPRKNKKIRQTINAYVMWKHRLW